MKNNRHGQAAILSNNDYSKIRKYLKSKKYILLIDIAWFTGERIGALIRLKVSDCYDENLKPRETITFQANTRKASPDGSKKTRQLHIHSTLKESLKAYKPAGDSEFLFHNRSGENHITPRWADKILRSALDAAELTAKGISWHSFRRTFITRLHRKGTDLYTIRRITGHKDLKSLERYVEIDVDQIKGAIEAL